MVWLAGSRLTLSRDGLCEGDGLIGGGVGGFAELDFIRCKRGGEGGEVVGVGYFVDKGQFEEISARRMEPRKAQVIAVETAEGGEEEKDQDGLGCVFGKGFPKAGFFRSTEGGVGGGAVFGVVCAICTAGLHEIGEVLTALLQGESASADFTDRGTKGCKGADKVFATRNRLQ